MAIIATTEVAMILAALSFSAAVEDNVAEIIKIESEYLDGLNDEAARLESMIDEKEYDGDADGDE